MAWKTIRVAVCDVCGHRWMPETGNPPNCPSKKCRSTLWNKGGVDGRTQHSGSFLVSAACREITKKGYHVVVAYADPAAGEKGVIFRARNFLYCGPETGWQGLRCARRSLATRDRRFGRLPYKRSRAEQKQILIKQGCSFYKDTGFKRRFVGIFGDRRMKRILRRALRWEVMEYPKQEPSTEDRVQAVDLDPVPTKFAASAPLA